MGGWEDIVKKWESEQRELNPSAEREWTAAAKVDPKTLGLVCSSCGSDDLDVELHTVRGDSWFEGYKVTCRKCGATFFKEK